MFQPSCDSRRPAASGRLALVVVSGAGEPGLRTALELCDGLPPLTCPTLFSLRDVDPAPLEARADGMELRLVTAGARLADARVWFAPGDRNTVVRNGAFVLGEPGVASVGQLPSLGMLYHSVRVEFGSRVFVVVTDHGREDTPVLRLLAQRGAGVVSPTGLSTPEGPQQWTIPTIVDHLATRVGIGSEVAVA